MVLQLGTLSIFLRFRPLLSKFMNYTEIMNEVFIFISVYYMMIFTNWIHNIELRYHLGFSLIHCLSIVTFLNLVIIAVCLIIAVNWTYIKWKYVEKWTIHNEKNSKIKQIK